jgi:hypothetical protein
VNTKDDYSQASFLDSQASIVAYRPLLQRRLASFFFCFRVFFFHLPARAQLRAQEDLDSEIRISRGRVSHKNIYTCTYVCWETPILYVRALQPTRLPPPIFTRQRTASLYASICPTPPHACVAGNDHVCRHTPCVSPRRSAREHIQHTPRTADLHTLSLQCTHVARSIFSSIRLTQLVPRHRAANRTMGGLVANRSSTVSDIARALFLPPLRLANAATVPP